jgi:pyruvate,orthophosphate dikinase
VQEKGAPVLARGLPAGPGGACGQIVFTAADAVQWVRAGKRVILVREETNPEDVEGMRAADGILTARGGMTSHAALVARGWGKCCIVGASALHVSAGTRTLMVESRTGPATVLREGDWVALNGSRGLAYAQQVQVIKVDVVDPATGEERRLAEMFWRMMAISDKYRRMKVRANADTAEDARTARQFGAEGIGLFRTEHMFYGQGSDEPLFLLRRMIMSRTTEERKKALEELYRFVQSDIRATLAAMDGLPVTFRLLDPPLHEFVPKSPARQEELAASLGITLEEVRERGDALHETNPMMGHRGVRLAVTYPEVAEMQYRAIFEATAELVREGKRCLPEIMIPVTCDVKELQHQRALCERIGEEVRQACGLERLDYLFGTMIEIPRAALLADRMADAAEFFSFGTNDMTQMGFGFSRDDIGGFMGDYLDQGILPADPFQTLDQDGIGQLLEMGVQKGRTTRPKLKVGICGEHGGDPASVAFCHRIGLDYVSCSPYRVPVARLAAAQAALADPAGGPPTAKDRSRTKPVRPAPRNTGRRTPRG